MRDSDTLVLHHKALMELSHDATFINQPRQQKLASLTRLCAQLLEVERVSIWAFPSERDRIASEWLHDRHAPRGDAGEQAAQLSLYRSEHPAYFDAIGTERVIAVERAQTDPRTRSFTRQYLGPHGIHAMLGAPLFDGERLSGVICLEARQNREWTVPEISLTVAIADTVSLMNTYEAWIRSQRALDYISRFDPLTGLANMGSLRDRTSHLIKKIKRRGLGSLAMVWIDVDRLKVINDGLGHQAGDQVLAEIGRRLQEVTVSGKDYLARIGGDEFALLIRNQTYPEALDKAADLIQQTICSPIPVSERELSISASLGICHYPGDCGETEELLRGAEAAMYHAKGLGQAQSTLFDSEIQMTARSRFALESDLRVALAQGDLDVFYQPIMNRSADRIESLEALVRWHHPHRGWLSPIEFLDVARSAGLMYQLGTRVLERVCQHWRASRDNGVHLPTLSVNLAAEQIQVAALPALIRKTCSHYSMPVSALQFEVTEDAIQGESGLLGHVLGDLVEAGAELAIDDFGTGYSSLARLKSLPFSRIKIDRSFIKNLPEDDDDCAIIRSILGLARGLGLSVVAEGVETEAHEQWLLRHQCDYLQGFRYSKPLPIDQLTLRYFSSGVSH